MCVASSAAFPAFLHGGSAVGAAHTGKHQPGDGAVSARPGFVCGVQNTAGPVTKPQDGPEPYCRGRRHS